MDLEDITPREVSQRKTFHIITDIWTLKNKMNVRNKIEQTDSQKTN